MMCDFTFNILETTALRNRVFKHKGNFADKKSPLTAGGFLDLMTKVYQSLFFILRFLLIFLPFFMPKGFDYFKLLGKRLHQGAVFGRFFGDGRQDVLIIGIGEHSAQ